MIHGDLSKETNFDELKFNVKESGREGDVAVAVLISSLVLPLVNALLSTRVETSSHEQQLLFCKLKQVEGSLDVLVSVLEVSVMVETGVAKLLPS